MTKTIKVRIIYDSESDTYYAETKGWFFWHKVISEYVYVGPSSPGLPRVKYWDTMNEAKRDIKEKYTKTFYEKKKHYKIVTYADLVIGPARSYYDKEHSFTKYRKAS